MPTKFAAATQAPRRYAPHDDDVVCLVKQRISGETVQALTVAPHNILERMPTNIPTLMEARKPTGEKGKQWLKFADRFLAQNPYPEFVRAGRYLRSLAAGTTAHGKTAVDMPWHSSVGGDSLRGVLIPDMPDLALSVPLRARWR